MNLKTKTSKVRPSDSEEIVSEKADLTESDEDILSKIGRQFVLRTFLLIFVMVLFSTACEWKKIGDLISENNDLPTEENVMMSKDVLLSGMDAIMTLTKESIHGGVYMGNTNRNHSQLMQYITMANETDRAFESYNSIMKNSKKIKTCLNGKPLDVGQIIKDLKHVRMGVKGLNASVDIVYVGYREIMRKMGTCSLDVYKDIYEEIESVAKEKDLQIMQALHFAAINGKPKEMIKYLKSASVTVIMSFGGTLGMHDDSHETLTQTLAEIELAKETFEHTVDCQTQQKLDDIRSEKFYLVQGTRIHIVLWLAMILIFLAYKVFEIRKFTKYLKGIQKFAESVFKKSHEIAESKQQSDMLLYQMLPRTIADQLKRGDTIHPERFEEVTVYFSDIIGFNDVALDVSPVDLVEFLNTIYNGFDECIEAYDVYKVETIADAYMVASGLPVRNGSKHATEIAGMALDMMKTSANFSLPGSEDPLPLRIGINSGPCVAGVVGLKNPRYCLFGDTINTASRMESTGEAYKIHCSENFVNCVEKIGGFNFEMRGQIQVKGKGQMTTYWLLDKISAMDSDSDMSNL